MGEIKRVMLITTGELERVALADSLQRFFDESAQLLQLQHPIEFVTSRKSDGFTSERVNPSIISDEQLDRALVTRLVTEMIAALTPRKRHDLRPDLVIAVDDVEVVNLDQIAHLTTYFRRAVARYLTHDSSKSQIVQQRCAFHLLSPMVESYLYIEDDIIARATSHGARPHQSILEHDLEHFQADGDPDYQLWLAESTADPAFCNRHPKRYIHYLSGDAPGAKSSHYKETHHGAEALRALEWSQVTWWSPRSELATPHMQCIHALLEEIVSLAGGRPYWEPSQAPTRAASTCLRNL